MTDMTKRETGRAAADANAAADRPQGERAPCREREARGDQTAAAHGGPNRALAPSQTDRTNNAIRGDTPERRRIAPPRNCDLYATLAEAVVACGLATAEAPSLSGMGAAQLYKFAKWLYVPASKGGAR